MLVQISFLFGFLVLGNCIHMDYIEIGRQLRMIKNIPEETFANSMKNLKFNTFLDFPDISGLENITMKCLEDMGLLLLAMEGSSLIPSDFLQTAAMVKDAMGAQPPGMLRGATRFYGFKQECDIIHYEIPHQKRTFETMYSGIFVNPAALTVSENTTCDSTNTVFIRFDVCLPKSCNADDILTIVKNVPLLGSMAPQDAICSVTTMDDIKIDYDWKTYVVLSIFFIVVILAVLSAVVDYFVIPEKSPLRSDKGVQLFLAFSFYRNVKEIMSAGKSNQPGQIGPIHFIRFISITWVVVCHIFTSFAALTNNLLDYFDLVHYPVTQVIMNGFYSVDNFFFIGAVLVSFMFFKELNKNRKAVMSAKGWFMFYFHRIVRLSPVYYMTIAFTTWVYLPFASQRVTRLAQEVKSDPCNDYFWRNILYINNLGSVKTTLCFDHGWYLATDMQMYIASPLILVPLAIKPVLGLIIAFVLICASTAANIITVSVNHYPPTVPILAPPDPEQKNIDEYDGLIYYAMWIRCQVYIIGLIVGWLLQTKKKLKIPIILQAIFWFVSLGLMLTVLFGLYGYSKGTTQLTLFERVLYSSLSKPAWALGLSWILIACYYGYGGFVNRFLSWNIWVPLGRISYVVYLIHIHVIDYVNSTDDHAFLFSGVWNVVYEHVFSILCLTFFLALIWSSLFEVPVGKIESILLRPRKRQIHIVEEKKDKEAITSWEPDHQAENGKSEKL